MSKFDGGRLGSGRFNGGRFASGRFGGTASGVAATLSLPGFSAVTDATATVNVTVSDPADGTLTGGVWPAASVPTDPLDIITGAGAAWAGSTSSPIAGVNSFSATGLTVGVAYKAAFVHRNPRTSNVVTSGEFTTATPVAPPTLVSATFFDNNDGTPATLALSYTGSVTGFRVYGAIGDGTLSVSAAQLYAGGGGTGALAFFSVAVGSNVDITGLTSAAEPGTRIAVALILEVDGSSASNVVTVTGVSGLDFTAPAFASATTDTTGLQVIVTLSENAFGSTLTSAWSVKINGTSYPPDSVSRSGTQFTLFLPEPAAIVSTDTVLVSYTPGDVTDGDGNALGAFTDQAVTNIAPSADVAPVFQALGTATVSATNISVAWPTHAAGDVAVLAVALQMGAGAGFLSAGLTSAGWTILENRLITSITPNRRHVIAYKRAASGAEASASINEDGTDSFAQAYGVIATFRGCVSTGIPAIVIGTQEQAAGTAISFVNGTTSGDARLVVGLMAAFIDTVTPQLSAGFTNAGLTGLTNIVQINTGAGGGQGHYGFAGEKPTAGAVGTTTGTLAASSVMPQVLIELIGEPA